ncbi:hypothetical protein [Clostridium fungisolvens]|uniref:DUF3800 domain-containing protein n=1 Tax=Clostridium fungisolvens TaxID=1604897 RepID=A0A6V8SL15_9CLOT|nr:hypothetical protein [Clostridium fungisolvens]GFP77451.1 hypothetical protein bsdtw1_03579 [Clostridium fungisolvens]
MVQYRFYYDESEHSRKINLNTVNATNYYDNFIAVIVGWKIESEKSVFEKYAAFEEKYTDRKSKGELKSQTLNQSQFKNGFASMNKSNVCFLTDFLLVFDSDIEVYFSVISKIEFIISQLFYGYNNSFFCDIDAMKYSIVKAILMYQPKEIIEGIFENTEELVATLKAFFKDRIQQNKVNLSLKQRETKAFEEILEILYDIHDVSTIEWNYDIAFLGFKKYITERAINDFILVIDKEGESSNTLNAAKKVGFSTAIEVDSKCSIGVRISDMLAGLLSKLLKSLHNSLRYNSSDEQLQKKILSKEWFLLSQDQLELYKKLYIIVCKLNNAWYKTFSGKYSDDLIMLIAFLNYMNHFSSTEEIRKQNVDMQGEYFNSYACEYLEDYFDRMRNKLPLNPISSDAKNYFFNKRGAKVFFDVRRQPLLKFTNGHCKCSVLSIGFSREGIPLATISEAKGNYCYRLPKDLSEWSMSVVGLANMGMNMFPAEVVFIEDNGKFYADVL